MAFLVRADLGMSRGKIAAQVAHAAFEFGRRLRPSDAVEEWVAGGMGKLVLAVRSLDELLQIADRAKQKRILAVTIVDGGRTEVPEDTPTVLGLFGEIDSLIGSLPLLRDDARPVH